jgi:WD40 repeat protein
MLCKLYKILSLTAVLVGLSLTNLKAQAAVLINSAGTDSVKLFDDQGNYIRDFVTPRSGGLFNGDGLGIGPDGNLYVSNFFGGGILRYNGQTGNFIDTFVPDGNNGLHLPTALLFGPDGNLYVSSYTNYNINLPPGVQPGTGPDQVLSFNPQTGAFIKAFDVPGPLGMAFGPDGNLYVNSIGNNNNGVLQINTTTGATKTFVTPGEGGLLNPAGLAFGPDGNLYVSSFLTNSVLRYSGISGQFEDTFVAAGSGGLDHPAGLAFRPDGTLLVNSAFNNSTLSYDGTTGQFLGDFASPGEGGLFGPNLGLLPSVNIAVPEPSSNLELVAFGALGLGLLIKQNLKTRI